MSWRWVSGAAVTTLLSGTRRSRTWLSFRLASTQKPTTPGSTVRLAKRHRLTVYDAAYLELAQRRGLPWQRWIRGCAMLHRRRRHFTREEPGPGSLISQLAYTNRGGAACTDFVS